MGPNNTNLNSWSTTIAHFVLVHVQSKQNHSSCTDDPGGNLQQALWKENHRNATIKDSRVKCMRTLYIPKNEKKKKKNLSRFQTYWNGKTDFSEHF